MKHVWRVSRQPCTHCAWVCCPPVDPLPDEELPEFPELLALDVLPELVDPLPLVPVAAAAAPELPELAEPAGTSAEPQAQIAAVRSAAAVFRMGRLHRPRFHGNP